MVFHLHRWIPWLRVPGQPSVPLFSPLREKLRRQGIGQSEGDETRRSIRPPVGKTVGGFLNLRPLAEKAELRSRRVWLHRHTLTNHASRVKERRNMSADVDEEPMDRVQRTSLTTHPRWADAFRPSLRKRVTKIQGAAEHVRRCGCVAYGSRSTHFIAHPSSTGGHVPPLLEFIPRGPG